LAIFASTTLIAQVGKNVTLRSVHASTQAAQAAILAATLISTVALAKSVRTDNVSIPVAVATYASMIVTARQVRSV
jgi:hypothetical protein